VIHGQTLNVLTRQVPCDAIIVIDDEIAADPFLSGVFKGMTNYKVLIFNAETALRKLPEAEQSQKNYFIVFKHPTTLANMVHLGYKIKLPSIMIGPQTPRPGTISFFFTMDLTEDEIVAIDEIEATGVEILMQSVLTEKPVTWQNAKAKIHLNREGVKA
jgi:PTS system mannose-specific IIB component